MDVHGAADRGVRQPGRHHVDDAVDGFVGLDAEQRGADDLLRLRVDQHLHEALRLATLARAAHARHRPRGLEHRAPRRACLVFRHARARKWRIGEQRIDRKAVGDAPRVPIEQVGGDDFVVVVGRVRERAAAVDIAQRPDAGYAGGQPVVDLDEAPGIGDDAGAIKSQVVGVGDAPDREQQMRAGDSAAPLRSSRASSRRRRAFLRAGTSHSAGH